MSISDGNLTDDLPAAPEPAAVSVVNIPDATLGNAIDLISSIATIISLLLSLLATYIAFQALKWAKESWKNEGPTLSAELSVVRFLSLVPNEAGILVGDPEPEKMGGFKELRITIKNAGRTEGHVGNMLLDFYNEEGTASFRWYTGLHFSIPAGGSESRSFGPEEVARAAISGLSAYSRVVATIEQSVGEDIIAAIHSTDIDGLNSFFDWVRMNTKDSAV